MEKRLTIIEDHSKVYYKFCIRCKNRIGFWADFWTTPTFYGTLSNSSRVYLCHYCQHDVLSKALEDAANKK